MDALLAATSGGHWVHDLDPVILHISGSFAIRWYGLAYLCGFLIGFLLLRRYHQAGRSPIGPQQRADLALLLVLGVFVGGRLGYFLFYRPDVLLSAPLTVLRPWEGGMASHGGFIGVALAMVAFSRWTRIAFWKVADLVVSIAPPGLLLGRIANFINGELWGHPSQVPWAVIFSNTGGGPEPRHPSQLYEAFAEGLVLLVYTQVRLWRTGVLATPGRLTGEFLVGYAIARIACEVFRVPDADTILGLSRGSFYSIFLLLAGGIIIASSRRAAPQS